MKRGNSPESPWDPRTLAPHDPQSEGEEVRDRSGLPIRVPAHETARWPGTNTFQLFRDSRWILGRMKKCVDGGTQLHEFPERVRWTIRLSSPRGATFAELDRGG